MAYDYSKKAVVLTDDFRRKYVQQIQGRDAIKLEGLTLLAHEKGLWKMDTKLIQFPSEQNNWIAICETIIGGYDYDPVTEKIREVEFSDIGDACVTNCAKNVQKSYIRMASTRSQGRALRKYVNVDILCTSELDSTDNYGNYHGNQQQYTNPEPKIAAAKLAEIKTLVNTKHIPPEVFTDMITKLFNMTNPNGIVNLTPQQGDILLDTVKNYVPVQQ